MDRIRFQLDEHVPQAVAQALRRRGIDVLTAAEAGLLSVPDAELLARSYAAGRVAVTHDSDFLRLHQKQHQHAGIAYCHPQARTLGQIIRGLALIWEIYEPEEMQNHVEFL